MSDPNPEFQSPPPPSAMPPPPKRRPTNLRVPSIVLLVVGVAVVIAGIAKVFPGGVGTGIAIAFVGLLFFALSFVPLPDPGPDAPPPMGTLERLTGIFFEPTRVFKNLRAHPKWLAGLLVIVIINAAYIAAFTRRLTAERIVNYTVDKMAETPFIPPEAVERARDEGLESAKSPAQQIGNLIKGAAGVVIVTCLLAALYMLGLLAFGGRINFWQSFAVVVYAALPAFIITKVVSFIILYLKSPDDIHPLRGQETLLQDNLGILFSPKDHPVLFVTAGFVGVLTIYKLWLTAKGLHEGGQRVSSSAAWGVSITLWLLGLLFLVSITALFPSFIS